MKGIIGAIAAWLLMLLSSATYAHDSRPAYLQINQDSPDAFHVRLQLPITVAPENFPELIVPEQCHLGGLAPLRKQGDAYVRFMEVQCGEAAKGRFFELKYPYGNPSLSTLVRYRSPDAAVTTQVLAPDQGRWDLPADRSGGHGAGDYFGLGLFHILVGYDHLLFLGCLIWIAGSIRRILLTVTGFTLAHSITLALAAFDVVRLAIPPLEAAIALSIVFLASELAKGRRDNLTWKYPVLVSSAFGLLHGFGFAAALGEIGLPRGEMTLALLLFNLGVEAGQLAVLSLLGLAVLACRRFGSRGQPQALSQPALQKAMAYVIGVFASLLMLTRLLAFAGS